MPNQKRKNASDASRIAHNRRARHDYHIEERFEAGIALEGWEVKSLRAGRVNLTEAYALLKRGELYLFGASIPPLLSASTHVIADERRTRKLLLHRREIDTLMGAVERKGLTVIPLAMYWKHNRAKVEIGIARGKQARDKRADVKKREWNIEKQRILRARNRSS
jgi:SsrA-binding protein